MEKLKMQTADMAERNIEILGQMFPNCLTEVKNDEGKTVRAIDFDRLRQELACEVVEGADERYQFTWPDKRNAIRLANAPINKTLRPCREESVDFDNTENLYIEGDNLEVLKLLRENYLGKVKMIYIDPPYNTGNDFVYNDDFAQGKAEFEAQSGLFDEEGRRMADPMVQNTESNGRFHTDWLNMIYPRLKVAKDLLADDGVIFISIGDSEIDNLTKMTDEIFGNSNKIGIVPRVMKSGGGKGQFFSPNIDYIVIYGRCTSQIEKFTEPISDDIIKRLYTSIETNGPRKGEKYRPFGLYQSSLDSRANQRYFIEAPDGTLLLPPGNAIPNEKCDGGSITPQNNNDKVWRWSKDRYLQEKALGNIEFKKSDGVLIDSEGRPAKWNVYTKIWLSDRQEEGMTPVNFITKYENRHSAKELKDLNIPFDFAKPTGLISYLAGLCSANNESIILDFFSGSATTAHAVMQLNAEDGGNRRFIMVQLPEKTDEKSEAYKAGYKNICEIGKERIRRAGNKIREELQNKIQTLEFSINALLNAKPSATAAMLPKQEQEAIATMVYKEQILPKIKEKEELESKLYKLDFGFRVLKLDTSNMKDVYYTPVETPVQQTLGFDELVDNIKWGERTPEDLLFQVLPECNLPLSSKIEEREIHGKKVFVVEDGYLIACFDNDINESVITAIAKEKPYYFVMCDRSIASDSVADNFDQIFNAYSKETVRRIL